MDFFRETTFWFLGSAAPSNFYTRYRLTKACWRTPEGGRPPPNNKLIVKT